MVRGFIQMGDVWNGMALVVTGWPLHQYSFPLNLHPDLIQVLRLIGVPIVDDAFLPFYLCVARFVLLYLLILDVDSATSLASISLLISRNLSHIWIFQRHYKWLVRRDLAAAQ